MKKIIAAAITAAMILGSAAVAYAAEYSDVKVSNWAYAAVTAMSDKAIVKGYPDGSFKPGSTVTYGEFIKMALIAASGNDVGNATSGNWALNYYNKALELKYFTAYDIDKSQLDQKITRAHMALIVSAILGDVKIENYDEIQKGIKDITYQTKYEYDITKSYAEGILTGYTDNTFKPEKTLSRAEAATVIYRLVDPSKRQAPSISEPAPIAGTTKDIIKNWNSFAEEGYQVDDMWQKSQSYRIVDGSSLGLTTDEINGVKILHFPAEAEKQFNGPKYLVKDGMIVEGMQPAWHKDGSYDELYKKSDITTIDYIANLDENYDAILIINPFKK